MYDAVYNRTERGKLVAKRREIRHAIPRLEKSIKRIENRIHFYRRELERLDIKWKEIKTECPKPRFSGQSARFLQMKANK
jgi:chromosome segregation ATPase